MTRITMVTKCLDLNSLPEVCTIWWEFAYGGKSNLHCWTMEERYGLLLCSRLQSSLCTDVPPPSEGGGTTSVHRLSESHAQESCTCHIFPAIFAWPRFVEFQDVTPSPLSNWEKKSKPYQCKTKALRSACYHNDNRMLGKIFKFLVFFNLLILIIFLNTLEGPRRMYRASQIII